MTKHNRFPASLRRAPWLLLGALLASSCGETVQRELLINVLTVGDEDVFTGANRVILQVAGGQSSETMLLPGQGFRLKVPGLRPGTASTGVVGLTAVGPAQEIIAIGRTPDIELNIGRSAINVQMQRPGTLARAHFDVWQIPIADQVMLAVPAVPLNQEVRTTYAVPLIAGGRVLVPAGDGTQVAAASTNELYVWNPLVQGRQRLMDVLPRHEASAVVTGAGELVIFGGVTGPGNPVLVDAVERVSLGRSDLDVFADARPAAAVAGGAATLRRRAPLVEAGAGGPLYAIGGLDLAGAPLDSIVAFDFKLLDATQQVTVSPLRLASPRGAHTATVVLPATGGAEVLVFGDARPGTPVAELITAPTASTPAAVLPLGVVPGGNRRGHVAVALDAKQIAIIGGLGDDDLPRADYQIYQVDTRTFSSPLPLLATPRSEATAFAIGKELVVLGGRDATGQPVPTAEVFDITMVTPAPLRTLPAHARAGTRAAPLPDGTMLLLGGVERDAASGIETPSIVIEVYRPSS